ncbi:hypothetical protein PSI19_13400 [Xenorhabdus khoisanae]|nr:hypothetical protein [Xenorhabdus khoisanae]MDC9614840.1 hypothetical protein [Xenorhabdus khoisanae]
MLDLQAESDASRNESKAIVIHPDLSSLGALNWRQAKNDSPEAT